MLRENIMTNNACINIISSRSRCIGLCLESLWDNYNHKHNYTVYVYYFDDIYDSEDFRASVTNMTPQRIVFRSIPYNTPKFIKEEELFYNRRNIQYVANSFSIGRKGYLHMCNFTSNMYGYENTELEKYDYTITHDDESGYRKEVTEDPVSVLRDSEYDIGAYFVGQRLRDGAPHQGHLDTRIGLWSFTKKFLEEHKVTPKNEKMKLLMTDPNAEWNFHFLDWCDTYVISNRVFETELWKLWSKSVNESGGIYKYRWGDNEIISLFAHMTQDKILDFGLVFDGTHDQGKFRGLQDLAPSIKHTNK